MKLIETKCPGCGSSLKLEKKEKQVECEYCGASFLLDDNVLEVKHLKAGEISDEQEFVNALTHLEKLQNYDEAYNIYLSLSNRYVDNPEVWIGLLRSLTKDFTYKYATSEFKELYEKYWKNYIALAKKKEIKSYEEKYNNYLTNVKTTSVNKTNIVQSETCYLVLTVLFGVLGAHKFIKGQIGLGLVYLFTMGLFGLGYVYDVYHEFKKWADSTQAQISKWIIAITFAIYSFVYIEYNMLAFLLVLSAGFLVLDYAWIFLDKKPSFNVRFFVPIIIFLIATYIGAL